MATNYFASHSVCALARHVPTSSFRRATQKCFCRILCSSFYLIHINFFFIIYRYFFYSVQLNMIQWPALLHWRVEFLHFTHRSNIVILLEWSLHCYTAISNIVYKIIELLFIKCMQIIDKRHRQEHVTDPGP